MIGGSRLIFGAAIRSATLLMTFSAGVILAGCTTVVATSYQATNDNVRTLQTLPGGKVSVGQFTAKSEELNHLAIRGSTYESPFNHSFAEYLKAALQTELESSGKFDTNAPVIISGELLTNALDPAIGTASAHISARIVIKRGETTIFDKVVRGDSEWDSSFIGGIAIPRARQQYGETLKKLLSNLFADTDFQKSI